jgi:hypothetical protein
MAGKGVSGGQRRRRRVATVRGEGGVSMFRRLGLAPVWAVIAVVSLVVASTMVVTASSPASASDSSDASSTCGAPTGIMGGAAVYPSANGSESVVMTALLWDEACGTDGLFVPLTGQTVYFAEENEGGYWYLVCTATTDSSGVATCDGDTAPDAILVNGQFPASTDVASWSVDFPGNSSYAGSSDNGQMPGVTQPSGPGTIGTIPGSGSSQITLVEQDYSSSCKPPDPAAPATLGSALTDGGNCQLIKIESIITAAVLGAALTVTGGEVVEVGFINLGKEVATAVAQASVKAFQAAQAGTDAVASAASLTSGVLNAVVAVAITSGVASGVGTLAGVGTALADGTLTVGSGNNLQIGSGTTLQNDGVIYNEGSITTADLSGLGGGTLLNDGTILNNGGSLAGLTITGNNYVLDFDSGGGSAVSPIQVLAPTVAASAQTLPTPTPPPGSNEIFDGWTTSGGTPITNSTELSSALSPGPSSTTLNAVYGPQAVTIEVDVPNVQGSNGATTCSGGQAGGGQITCGNLADAIAYVDTDNFFANHNVTIETGSGTYDGNYTVSLPSGVLSLTILGSGGANTTENGSGAAGSVFYVVSGNVTISDMTITGGTGTNLGAQTGNGAYGGGVYVAASADVTLSGDIITGNSAVVGGGVSDYLGGILTITDSLLSDNTASANGGGIEDALGTVTMTNDTLTGDSSPSGGAVQNEDGFVTMTFDTVAFDTSAFGAGISAQDYAKGNVTIANSILDSAGCAVDFAGAIVDGGYNVESDNSCGLGPTSIVNSSDIDLATSLSRESGQPAQSPEVLQLSGSSSAALEVPASSCTVGLDAAGIARPQLDAPACDAGAVDATGYQPTAPAVQNALGGVGQATITWSPSAFDGLSPIASYTVTATDQTNAANGGQTCTVSASHSLSCVVSDLTDGDTYAFAVSATNASYTSQPSMTSLPVVPAGPPGTPTITSVVVLGDTQATVSWTPPSDDGGAPIAGYIVTAEDLTNPANGGQNCEALDTDPNSCTISGLDGGDSYSFGAAALNGGADPAATVTAFDSGASVIGDTSAAGTSNPMIVGPATATLSMASSSPLPGDNTYAATLVVPSGAATPEPTNLTISDGTTACQPTTLTNSAPNTYSGSCTLDDETGGMMVSAVYSGDANFAPATSTNSLTVLAANQAALTVTSATGTAGTPLVLTTSGGSDNGTVSYSLTSAGAAGCSISNGLLSATSAGTCSVTASMAGDGGYNQVSSSVTTITINPGLSVVPLTLTAGTVGSLYNQIVTISGGTAPYTTFAVSAFNAGGTGIAAPTTNSGAGSVTFDSTPTATGTVTFTLNVTDSAGAVLTQNYSVLINPGPVTTHATTITSASTAYFRWLCGGTFTITTTGTPTATLSEKGTLPAGLKFTNNRNGTATLSGFASLFALGTSTITVSASNGVGTATTQTLKIVVGFVPKLATASATTFSAGHQGSYLVASVGYPVGTVSETGTLPTGVTLKDNGNGTATLSGAPAAATAGVYILKVSATNGFGTATQTLTLTVGAAPAITSAASTIFTIGKTSTFSVTATGTPAPTMAECGTLPKGVTFVVGANGTATLSGIPAKGTNGSYRITLSATNGVTPAAGQTFTLNVST